VFDEKENSKFVSNDLFKDMNQGHLTLLAVNSRIPSVKSGMH
jgi:hypothetical protein